MIAASRAHQCSSIIISRENAIAPSSVRLLLGNYGERTRRASRTNAMFKSGN